METDSESETDVGSSDDDDGSDHDEVMLFSMKTNQSMRAFIVAIISFSVLVTVKSYFPSFVNIQCIYGAIVHNFLNCQTA